MNISKESLGDSFNLTVIINIFGHIFLILSILPFMCTHMHLGMGWLISFSKYKNKDCDFEKIYQLLKAGGSKNYKELLKPFNLNISKKDFWEKSISVIDNLIDELSIVHNYAGSF